MAVTAAAGLVTASLVTGLSPAAAAPESAPLSAGTVPVFEEVIGAQLDANNSYEHVRHLSVEIGPRLNGTPQEREGAEYIGGLLESYGFEVSYPTFGPVSTKRPATITSPNVTLPGTNNWQMAASTSGKITGKDGAVQAEVVYAGSGQSASNFPENTAGKIVLMDYSTTAATRNTAVVNAVARGAVGVILAYMTGNSAPPSFTLTTAQPTIPVVGGGTYHGVELRSLVEAGPVTLNLRTDEYVSPMGVNVIGIRKAVGDPEGTTAPIISIGAHIDSVLGSPGAHDDATGNGVMLEIARVMSQFPLDKELRVGGFGGEEGGLLGSRAYVNSLSAAERARYIGHWQMDMVGTPYAPAGLWALTPNGLTNFVVDEAYKAAERSGFESLQNCRLGQSDHQPYYDVGIPAALFIWLDYRKPANGICGSSGGTYVTEPQYHRPSDNMDNVSKERLQITLDVIGRSFAYNALNGVMVEAKTTDGDPIAGALVQANCGDGWMNVGTTNAAGVAENAFPHGTCTFKVAGGGAAAIRGGVAIAGDTTVTFGQLAAGPGSGYQEIVAEVLAGPLYLSVPSSVVTMPNVTLDGYDQVVDGELNGVLVGDPRGTSAGWSLTGQVSDFVGPNGLILADNLGWVPNAAVVPGTLPVPDPSVVPSASVVAGPSAAPGSGIGNASTLCSSPAGASAGAFTCGADLNLGIPASTRAGTYTGVLTLTLV